MKLSFSRLHCVVLARNCLVPRSIRALVSYLKGVGLLNHAGMYVGEQDRKHDLSSEVGAVKRGATKREKVANKKMVLMGQLPVPMMKRTEFR